jgi:hypothetical protein
LKDRKATSNHLIRTMPAKGKRLAGAFCTIFAQTSCITYQDQPLGTPTSLSSCRRQNLMYRTDRRKLVGGDKGEPDVGGAIRWRQFDAERHSSGGV